jgi:hypothetical protein
MKVSKENQERAKSYLINLFSEDTRVYTKVNHVSSSGMTRHISCYVARDNQIIDITWYVSQVIGERRNSKDGGIVVSGCGMDMGFALVYSLSQSLYPKGFYLNEGECGRNGDTSGYDCDGGYRLKQQWV